MNRQHTAVHDLTFLFRHCRDFNYCCTSVNEWLRCMRWWCRLFTVRAHLQGPCYQTVCHWRKTSPGPPWSEPSCRPRLMFPSLNIQKMVQRDNMSDCRGLIITLTEGPVLTFPRTHLPVQWDPKIKLHISLVILSFATFGAVTPFVKANVFLPASAALMLAGKPDTTAEWFTLTCNIPYAEIWQNAGWQCHADVRRPDHLAKHQFQDMGVQVMYQTRMLFMQFTNEMAGPLLHLKKERKIYKSLEK